MCVLAWAKESDPLPVLLLHPAAVLPHCLPLRDPEMSLPSAMPCAVEVRCETTCFAGHPLYHSTSYEGVQVSSASPALKKRVGDTSCEESCSALRALTPY